MTDWIEIAALIAGPVAAVGITLWREKGQGERERQVGVMRQLLLTRASPFDPAFSTAINLVPIEFSHNEKVMAKWEAFSRAAGQGKATPETTNKLLQAIMIALGHSERAAAQVAATAYRSAAEVERSALVEAALKSLPLLSLAAEKGSEATTYMADLAKKNFDCSFCLSISDFNAMLAAGHAKHYFQVRFYLINRSSFPLKFRVRKRDITLRDIPPPYEVAHDTGIVRSQESILWRFTAFPSIW